MTSDPTPEDLAPSADLRPLAARGHRPTFGTSLMAARAVVPGLGLVAACVGVAFTIAWVVPSVSPLVASVAIGAVLANMGLIPEWSRAGTHFAAKRLLRVGVVLLGFRLAIGEVLRLGGPGLAVVAVVVTSTFFGTQWLGRRLGVSRSLSLLIATGFSICGASAVAAVEGVSDADEEEVAFAIGLVTLCGSLAIGLLPALSGVLGLHGTEFGAWVGASVHDVAQVVATASTDGAEALRAAVVVKLTRVLLLAPIVAGVTLQRRRNMGEATDRAGDPDRARPPVIPLFVAGFMGAILLRSASVVPAGWLPSIEVIETIALAAALVGLGTGVRIARLRRLGGRPLVLAMCSWLLVAVVSYVGVITVGV